MLHTMSTDIRDREMLGWFNPPEKNSSFPSNNAAHTSSDIQSVSYFVSDMES